MCSELCPLLLKIWSLSCVLQMLGVAGARAQFLWCVIPCEDLEPSCTQIAEQPRHPLQGGNLDPSGSTLIAWSCDPWLGIPDCSNLPQQCSPVAQSGEHTGLLQVALAASLWAWGGAGMGCSGLYSPCFPVAQSGVHTGFLWVIPAVGPSAQSGAGIKWLCVRLVAWF